MSVLTFVYPFRQTARPRRPVRLAVETMEHRLVLSPTLPLPPPHAAIVVAEFPTGPVRSQVVSYYPIGPVRSQVVSYFPIGPV